MVIAYFPVFHRSVLFASSCLVTKSRKLTNDFTLGPVIPKTITRRVIVLIHLKYILLCLIMTEEVKVWKVDNGD